MAVRNLDWYALNCSRAYPLADDATGTDDLGRLLPHNILADIYLRYPVEAGRYAYISAITASPLLVTLMISSSTSPTAAENIVTLAAVTVKKPIVAGRQYAVEAIYPGVGGWVVWGKGFDSAETFTARFSTPRQSKLLPRTAKTYTSLPIPGVGKLYAKDELTGLVRLSGGNDIEIVKECREVPLFPPAADGVCSEVNSQARDVVVIRLKNTVAPASDRNVYDIYRGPCGDRPESLTCGDPAPIEFINTIAPDCCGNITLVFEGCASITQVTAEVTVDEQGDYVSSDTACGIIIDCGLGLTDACVRADRLPDADGKLPNEYDDLCVSESSEVDDTLPGIGVPGYTFSVDSGAQSAAADPGLPDSDNFQVPDWTVYSGAFDYLNFNTGLPAGDVELTTAANGAGQGLNFATWDSSPNSAYYRQARAQFRFVPGLTNELMNAGVIANHYVSGNSFWFAQLVADAQPFGYQYMSIGWYNGASLITLIVQAVPNLIVGQEYAVTLAVVPHPSAPEAAWLVASFEDLTTPANDFQMSPKGVGLYAPITGKFGVMTNRSRVYFSSFTVDNTSL